MSNSNKISLQIEPKNIIIKMPNWLGDLVMSTPVLKDVRNKWPSAQITAMSQSNVAPLLENNPHINEIYSYVRPSGWIPHQQHWEIVQTLEYGRYDLGILLTNSLSSAFWLWQGNVQNRIGYACNLRSLLLTKAVPFPENVETQHLITTYKMLLAPLGIPLSDNAPELFVSEEESENAKNLLKKLGVQPEKNLIIGINPGAAYGSAKCWLPERFTEITHRLLKNPNIIIVYFGDHAGAPLVNEVCKDMPERVINLAGKTSLRELMALIKYCNIFLTNDSGPMHIASALNVPVLALFGSTSDVKTGPYGIAKVLHKHVECSPCYKRVCPIDFRCMKKIEVDEVYKELQEMLKK